MWSGLVAHPRESPRSMWSSLERAGNRADHADPDDPAGMRRHALPSSLTPDVDVGHPTWSRVARDLDPAGNHGRIAEDSRLDLIQFDRPDAEGAVAEVGEPCHLPFPLESWHSSSTLPSRGSGVPDFRGWCEIVREAGRPDQRIAASEADPVGNPSPRTSRSRPFSEWRLHTNGDDYGAPLPG